MSLDNEDLDRIYQEVFGDLLAMSHPRFEMEEASAMRATFIDSSEKLQTSFIAKYIFFKKGKPNRYTRGNIREFAGLYVGRIYRYNKEDVRALFKDHFKVRP